MTSHPKDDSGSPHGKTVTEPGRTLDEFLGGRVNAFQPVSGPRSGIDAIFLAAAVPVRHGGTETVLEAGAGVGVASLAVAARVADVRITAVELQHDLAQLAVRNATANGLARRFNVIEADVMAPAEVLVSAGLRRESYQHVAANPPYYDPARTRSPADAAKARAHLAGPGELEGWLRFCAAMAASGASLTLIHRPENLGELIGAIGNRFGGIVLFPLFPYAGKPASRILIQAIKGSRAPLAMRCGMVLHRDNGEFTTEAEAVLRGCEALDIRT